MGTLEDEVQRLLSKSLAKGTFVSYRKSLEKFCEFRDTTGLDNIWPSCFQQVAAFIAHLSLTGLAASSINSHVSGISFVHKINNWPDPTNNFLIQKLREGCKRDNKAQDSRCPITLPLLKRLLETLTQVCRSDFEFVLFKTAFTLAFFAFLRVGEFAKTQCNDMSKIISIYDISCYGSPVSKVMVRIRSSKNDQTGQGASVVLVRNNQQEICPVTAIMEFLAIRPNQSGPFFIHFDGSPLSSGQFAAILKKSVEVAGLNPFFFSPHSFRIGAATSAAIGGSSVEEIKIMGRWRSECVRGYIRPDRIVHTSTFK